jgi:hypothetical protein
MSHDPTSTPETKRSPGILLGLGVLILLLAGLVGGLLINRSPSATASEDSERAAVRLKNLEELRSADSNALTTYGWNDRARGIVRIPVRRAMDLVLPQLQASENIAPKEARP